LALVSLNGLPLAATILTDGTATYFRFGTNVSGGLSCTIQGNVGLAGTTNAGLPWDMPLDNIVCKTGGTLTITSFDFVSLNND
jgi:hypothetical protein